MLINSLVHVTILLSDLNRVYTPTLSRQRYRVLRKDKERGGKENHHKGLQHNLKSTRDRYSSGSIDEEK